MDTPGHPARIVEADQPLKVGLGDVFRATMAQESGNVGYLGLAPDGSGYHVVVPVDLQIARGVMACNLPGDGTPFGGYSGWLYYECAPFEAQGLTSRERLDARWSQARANARVLAAWSLGRGIKVEIVEN